MHFLCMCVMREDDGKEVGDSSDSVCVCVCWGALILKGWHGGTKWFTLEYNRGSGPADKH